MLGLIQPSSAKPGDGGGLIAEKTLVRADRPRHHDRQDGRPGAPRSSRAIDPPVRAVSPPGSVAIGLLGDVMLGRMVAGALRSQQPGDLWAADLRALARSLDLVVCNLECCISERGQPTTLISGKPFFFRGPPVAVEALRAMNIGAVGLANNHALSTIFATSEGWVVTC